MFLVRDIFQCKPGRSGEMAARLKRTVPSMETQDRFRNCRVMVDSVADYWTVVLEAEFESLSDLERHMADYSSRADVREAMAGYMDLVQTGRREIFRMV